MMVTCTLTDAVHRAIRGYRGLVTNTYRQSETQCPSHCVMTELCPSHTMIHRCLEPKPLVQLDKPGKLYKYIGLDSIGNNKQYNKYLYMYISILASPAPPRHILMSYQSITIHVYTFTFTYTWVLYSTHTDL